MGALRTGFESPVLGKRWVTEEDGSITRYIDLIKLPAFYKKYDHDRLSSHENRSRWNSQIHNYQGRVDVQENLTGLKKKGFSSFTSKTSRGSKKTVSQVSEDAHKEES